MTKKKILIKSLNLLNFAGVRSFDLSAEGKDVVISARNGRGKTTIADAVMWVLTGKDSIGNAPGTAFPIKTRGADHEFLHGLEHGAELVINVDGTDMALKKVYSEKWTKKRDSAEKLFEGHETQHYIDDVPLSEKEYQARLSNVANEQTWRLLMDPLYFSLDRKGDKFDWKARREILFTVCGGMTDDDIIASSPKLKELPSILGNRSIDDAKAVLKAQLKKLKNEIEDIPIRISETQRNLPDVNESDLIGIEDQFAELRKHLQDKQNQVARMEAGGEAADIKRQIAEAQASLIAAQNKAGTSRVKDLDKMRAELNAIGAQGQETTSNINRLESQLRDAEYESKKAENKLNEMAEQWGSLTSKRQVLDEQVFAFDQVGTCPTCGQDLPESQLSEARAKAEADFNLEKSKNLAFFDKAIQEIDAEGVTQSKIIDMGKKEITEIKYDLSVLEERRHAATENYKAKQKDISFIENSIAPASPEMVAEQSKIDKLNESLSEIQKGNREETDKLHREITSIYTEIGKLESIKGSMETYNRGKSRIAELEADEKRLASEFEKCEGNLFMLEEFVRVKCDVITQSINHNFSLARFKLFDTQVNGAIVECCEVIGPSGAGFNSGLSQGEQMRVGVDIINRLQDHFEIIAPIMLDKAESLTEAVPTKAQMIRLKAVEGLDKLTINLI